MRNRIIIGLAAALLLMGTGCAKPSDGAAIEAARKQGFEQGRDAGRKEMAEEINQKLVAKGVSAPLDQPVHQVFGFVKEVSGGGFTVEYDSAQFSIVDLGKVTKRVTMDNGAVLVKFVPLPVTDEKTSEKQSSGGGQAPKPPTGPGGSGGQLSGPPTGPLGVTGMVPTETKASLSDLKAGAYVRIVTSNDARTADVLQASAVSIYDVANLPAEASGDPTQLPFSKAMGVPYVPSPGEGQMPSSQAPPSGSSPAPTGVVPASPTPPGATMSPPETTSTNAPPTPPSKASSPPVTP